MKDYTLVIRRFRTCDIFGIFEWAGMMLNLFSGTGIVKDFPSSLRPVNI